MSTLRNPQRESISHGGAANTAFPTRDANNNVTGAGVVAKDLRSFHVSNQAGAAMVLTVEEYDPGAAQVVDSIEYQLTSAGDETREGGGGAVLFSVSRGNRLRFDTDGAAEIHATATDRRL